MSAEDGGGQPLKILNVDGRSLELEEHSLARLLLDERVKDKPVVVIAVVGAFRKGKSFLLCFLLRYLRNMGRADWLGDPDAPLEGFEWRGGSERQTTGILMWNEVFLVKDSQGDELAVLLMDTQGTFDSQSPTVVHSSIFALSAMISSVLVYNVSCARPFQSLLFLVRDWPSAWEMQYGELGGRELLEKRLQVAEGQDEELRQLRMKIFKCFMKINCFLMPHPGLTASISGIFLGMVQATDECSFDGRLSDISATFKQHLPELVLLLLQPDNLLPKEINGRKITCQELMSYIQVYVNSSKKGLLREASSMLEVTHAASCRAALDSCLDFYTTSMIVMWQCSTGDIDRDTMRGYHNQIRELAAAKYTATPKMGGEEQARAYLEKLLEKMDATFDVYCEYLTEKDKRSLNPEFFDHVARNVAHGFVTTGLGAAAIALAVVELPLVAIALALAGAVSLSGHIIQVVVEMKHAKRKKKASRHNSAMAAEDARGRGTCATDSDESDYETPI
ncbi:hypothetical protein MTO96_035422, partial [Rhipicephalus appendiculatus]